MLFKLFRKSTPLWLLGVFLILLAFSSCKKKEWLKEGGQLVFSTDTLVFDTVFTAQGSSTRSIKIFNPQKENVTISSIRLGKGANSPYRINVNGYHGKEVDDIDLAGKDSLWIFAAVTIDPTDQNTPFVVEDQLIVTLNNQEFTIPIIAFGQNAYYIVDSVLETQTWRTDKPYIIVQNALVDQGATLTIPAGARVYVHQDSRLYVQGTLKITGTAADSVIFQGDRIDRKVYVGDYSDVPGEWGGLYFFQESYGNVIDHAVFKNGGAGTALGGQSVLAAMIQVDPDTVRNGQPKLRITNTKIHTSQGYGILAFNSSIYAENCLITECGAENVMLFEGGSYKFYDCTIATYGGDYLAHDGDNVSMMILNYFPVSQYEYIGADLTAEVKNCIVYGTLKNEIMIQKKDDFAANVLVQNCLMKSVDGIGNFVSLQDVLLNRDPMFKNRQKEDYHLKDGSPAIGAGIAAGDLNTDMDGKVRAHPPTIGCYEF